MVRGSAVVVVLIALALSACRAGPAPSAPSGRSAQTPTTASPPADLCRDTERSLDLLRETVSAGLDAQGVQAVYGELEAFLHRAAAAVPGELRPEVERAAETLSAFNRTLSTAGYDLSRVPPDAWVTLEAPEFNAALTHLADYSVRTCGVSN